MARNKEETILDLDKSLPGGIYVAALTPLHEDLSCDDDELFLHCLDLLQRGCKGVALFGTTGEDVFFCERAY